MVDNEVIIKELESFNKKNKIKGSSLAVFDNENVLFSHQFGIAEKMKEEDRLINEETRFKIGFLSKFITVLSIMQLCDKGKLRLDDNITKHLPNFSIKSRFGYQNITIRDILNERSGIPCDNYAWNYGKEKISSDNVIEFLKEQYLISPPKMMSAKSTLAYSVLGKIIEEVSGQLYNEYVNENIFKPLDIERAFIENDKEKYDFSLSFDTFGYDLIETSSVIEAAKSNIYLKVTDILKLFQILLNDGKYHEIEIVSKKMIDEMLEEPFYEDEVLGVTKTNLGLDFNSKFINTIGKVSGCEIKNLYHCGYVMISSENKVGAIYLSNTESTLESCEKACSTLIKRELNLDCHIEKKSVVQNYVQCRVEDYAGSYPTVYGPLDVFLGDFLTLKYKNDIYKMQLREDGSFDLLTPKSFSSIFSKEKVKKSALIKNGLITLINEEDEEIIVDTIGCFVRSHEVDIAWKQAMGDYEIVNEEKEKNRYICDKMTLTYQDGFMQAIFNNDTAKHVLTLGIVNSNEAIILGYGNHSNATMFLNLSNIKYCGLSYTKVKESPLNKIKEKYVDEEKIAKKLKQKKINEMFDFKE